MTWTMMRLAAAGLLAWTTPLSEAAAQGVSPQSSPPIYQNRDEPGRNPYQEYQFGCTTDCTLTFKTIPPGRRRVITNITCDQFVPSNGNVILASLQSTNNTIFIPIGFSYASPYNQGAGSLYIANISTLAYFGPGTTPVVRFVGSSVPLANEHCNLSGYDVML